MHQRLVLAIVHPMMSQIWQIGLYFLQHLRPSDMNRKCPLWVALLQNWLFFAIHGERIAQNLEMSFPFVRCPVQLIQILWTGQFNSMYRGVQKFQRELPTFGSKNVIWLDSLGKHKSDLTRWTNNRDERQTTDLWVTPTDKGSASLGNMNALHINKIWLPWHKQQKMPIRAA